MSQTEIIKVPDLGGASQVDVIEILVNGGDVITVDQGLMTVEGDKASMDIPAPVAGTITQVLVKVGDQVSEGDALFEISHEQTVSAEPDTSPSSHVASKSSTTASTSVQTIKVPDLGGAASVDIIEQHVQVGDTIVVDDPIMTVEGDKASMDIPAPIAGTITTILSQVGSKVSEGDPLLELEVTTTAEVETTEALSAPEVTQEQASTTAQEVVMAIPDLGGAASVDVIEVHVQVGDHIEQESPVVTLEGDKASMEVPATHSGKVTALNISVGDKVSEGDALLTLITEVTTIATPASSASSGSPKASTQAAPAKPVVASAPESKALSPEAMNKISFADVHASPSVRRFARDLGVDLTQVKGSGPKDRVTQKDVQAFVKGVMTGAKTRASVAPTAKTMTVDFSEFGKTTHEPFNKIKRMTGKHMDFCWTTIPHVTQFGEADITEMEAFRQEHKDEAKALGIRLTPLAFITQVLGQTLQEFPHFNASLDPTGEGLIIKHYTNIGIAVETPNGLVVPVIRDVMEQSIMDLAKTMGDISKKARDGALTANDMKGGSMTISSLGGIGGTAFTPIVNAPEVAILGISKSYMKPVYQDGEFVPRLMLPLSLSYDHRVIDGAEGARFLTRFSELLGDIRNLLLV